MEVPFPLRASQAIGVVVIVGIILGLGIAIREAFRPPPPEAAAIPTAVSEAPVFAGYFSLFFPGRTPDGSLPRARSQLVPSRKFAPGERAALRVQTALSVRQSFDTEIRILRPDTHEEPPELQRLRKRFRIRPGLRTYCCLIMPRPLGNYDLAVLVDNAFVTFYSFTVKAPREL